MYFLSHLFPILIMAANLGSVQVMAEQAGTPLSLLSDDGSTVIKQIEYIGLEAWTKPVTTEIRFSGQAATPNATVTVTVPDATIAQAGIVAADGSWTMTIPTSSLTAGSYYAYVTVSDDQVTNPAVPVAYFTVLDDQSLSWQTWVFLGTSLLAILALLSAITLQLGYNSKYHPVL